MKRIDRFGRSFPRGERLGDLQHRDGTGAVVVRTVVDGVGTRLVPRQRAEAVEQEAHARRLVGRRLAPRAVLSLRTDHLVEHADGVVIHGTPVEPDVVVMRADGHVLARERGVRPGEDGDHVPAGHQVLDESHIGNDGASRLAFLRLGDGRAENGVRHAIREADRDRLGVGAEQAFRRGMHEGTHEVVRELLPDPGGDCGGALECGLVSLESRGLDELADVAPGWQGSRREEHQLPAQCLGRQDIGRIERPARVDHLQGPEGPRRAGGPRDEIGTHGERRSVDRERRSRVERPVADRELLEVRPVVSRGEQAKPAHLALDVRRPLVVVDGADPTTHHRVIGKDVESRHEVAGRDVGDCRRTGVVARKDAAGRGSHVLGVGRPHQWGDGEQGQSGAEKASRHSSASGSRESCQCALRTPTPISPGRSSSASQDWRTARRRRKVPGRSVITRDIGRSAADRSCPAFTAAGRRVRPACVAPCRSVRATGADVARWTAVPEPRRGDRQATRGST